MILLCNIQSLSSNYCTFKVQIVNLYLILPYYICIYFQIQFSLSLSIYIIHIFYCINMAHIGDSDTCKWASCVCDLLAWSQALIPVWQSRKKQPSSMVSWPPIKQRQAVLASAWFWTVWRLVKCKHRCIMMHNEQELNIHYHQTHNKQQTVACCLLPCHGSQCNPGSWATSDRLSMTCGLRVPHRGAMAATSGPTTTPNPAFPLSLTWQSANMQVPAAMRRTQSLIPLGWCCSVPAP